MDENQIHKNENIYLTLSITAWIFSYTVFRSFLAIHLKNQHIPIIERYRIINSLWNFTFHTICFVLLQSYYLSSMPLVASGDATSASSIYFIMKGFGLHYVGINLYICNAWKTGISYFLFTLFVFNNIKDCLDCYILYLFLIKSLNISILEACRFVFLSWKDVYGHIFSKFLFMIHCVLWVYMYFYFIPNYLVLHEIKFEISRLLYFYLWYIVECLDSVLLKLLHYNQEYSWFKNFRLFPTNEENPELRLEYLRLMENSIKILTEYRRKRKKYNVRKFIRMNLSATKFERVLRRESNDPTYTLSTKDDAHTENEDIFKQNEPDDALAENEETR